MLTTIHGQNHIKPVLKYQIMMQPADTKPQFPAEWCTIHTLFQLATQRK